MARRVCALESSSFFVVVYKKGGYLEAVNTCAKLSMMKAVTEVKVLPNYAASRWDTYMFAYLCNPADYS